MILETFHLLLSFNDKLIEWVGSNYCLHFLPTMISFTTPMRLLVEMASDDPFICTSTVLSWSSVFLMVWYTEHIWLLPLSQHCSSGIKFIFLLLFCFLFLFLFLLFSSLCRRSKDLMVFSSFSLISLHLLQRFYPFISPTVIAKKTEKTKSQISHGIYLLNFHLNVWMHVR